jgi:hypothetical protein
MALNEEDRNRLAVLKAVFGLVADDLRRSLNQAEQAIELLGRMTSSGGTNGSEGAEGGRTPGA